MKKIISLIHQSLKSVPKMLPNCLFFFTLIVFIIPVLIIAIAMLSVDNIMLALIVAITKSGVGTKTKISFKVNNDEKKNQLEFIYKKEEMKTR